jgi:rare lipoprotein A
VIRYGAQALLLPWSIDSVLEISLSNRLARVLTVWAVCACALGLAADAGAAGNSQTHESASSRPEGSAAKVKPDLSGRKRVGKASFYARRFAGKKMADGTKMDPHDNNAASKTLPLGTTAKVTNLDTGQSAVVTIQDRGPHVKGRIVDLSPATAQKIGITQDDGVAKVKVDPIAVPMPDGSVKPGVAAKDTKDTKDTKAD